MAEPGEDLVLKMHREAAERLGDQPRPCYEPPTIHYTELPDAKPDSPVYREWNTFRREVGRLLREGHAGKFVLIKGKEIVGIWNTRQEASAIGYQRFLLSGFIVQQIREREPLLRWPLRCLSRPSLSSRAS
jgi:hypothetical protein